MTNPKRITCTRCSGKGILHGCRPMMGQCYLCLGAGEYVPIRRQWFGVTIEAQGRTFKSTVKVEGGETGAVTAAEALGLFQNGQQWVKGKCVSVKRINVEIAQQFADKFGVTVVEVVDGKPVHGAKRGRASY